MDLIWQLNVNFSGIFLYCFGRKFYHVNYTSRIDPLVIYIQKRTSWVNVPPRMFYYLLCFYKQVSDEGITDH